MKRGFLVVALVLATSFLSSCDGSGGSATGGTTDTTGGTTSTTDSANGTLVVDGVSRGVHVAALFDDTTLTLTLTTRYGNPKPDTGFILIVGSVPGAGTQGFGGSSAVASLSVDHKASSSANACFYTPTAGDLNISAWTASGSGSTRSARISGSGTSTLSLSLGVASCPAIGTANFQFDGVSAAYATF
jgi:hypothetical protein